MTSVITSVRKANKDAYANFSHTKISETEEPWIGKIRDHEHHVTKRAYLKFECRDSAQEGSSYTCEERENVTLH